MYAPDRELMETNKSRLADDSHAYTNPQAITLRGHAATLVRSMQAIQEESYPAIVADLLDIADNLEGI